MKQESAETVALQALQWIATNEETMAAFLSASGASVTDLSKTVADPVFLGFVLDFVLSEDVRVMGFCDSIGIAYTIPGQARQCLPGAATINWT
jgi:hypothetical protein